jgi:uncharacterized protein with PQ loop repeat
MLDFVLSIFSTIFQMNMRDHHDIPFALPLVMAVMVGFVVGFVILSMIGNENRREKAKQDR